MKTFIAAFALIAALPAAAQTQTAPAPEHSGHQHDGDCCKHKDADGKMMDCCKDAKKDCCDKHDRQSHDGHASHGMNR